MSEDTFTMLVGMLDDEQLKRLWEDGLFKDKFIFILETEMFKRCLI